MFPNPFFNRRHFFHLLDKEKTQQQILLHYEIKTHSSSSPSSFSSPSSPNSSKHHVQG
jgi:hypothetical protein